MSEGSGAGHYFSQIVLTCLSGTDTGAAGKQLRSEVHGAGGWFGDDGAATSWKFDTAIRPKPRLLPNVFVFIHGAATAANAAIFADMAELEDVLQPEFPGLRPGAVLSLKGRRGYLEQAFRQDRRYHARFRNQPICVLMETTNRDNNWRPL